MCHRICPASFNENWLFRKCSYASFFFLHLFPRNIKRLALAVTSDIYPAKSRDRWTTCVWVIGLRLPVRSLSEWEKRARKRCEEACVLGAPVFSVWSLHYRRSTTVEFHDVEAERWEEDAQPSSTNDEPCCSASWTFDPMPSALALGMWGSRIIYSQQADHCPHRTHDTAQA
jgi:hypothetical protein